MGERCVCVCVGIEVGGAQWAAQWVAYVIQAKFIIKIQSENQKVKKRCYTQIQFSLTIYLSLSLFLFLQCTVEVLFLAWGVRLCIMVRKAPSEFNESRFISMAIYNEFLLTCFLNVSM